MQLCRFFLIGEITRVRLKRQAGQDIRVRIVQLVGNHRRALRMLDDMVGQTLCICNRAGQHRRLRVFVGTDNARHLEGQRVVIQIAQAGIRIPQVGVKAGGFIIAVAVGVENHPEICAADILI